MKFLTALTVVAGLAVATAASAQSAGHRISVRDLDMTSPADARAFDQRVDQAGRRLCARAGRDLAARSACMADVRAEAVETLPSQQRVDYVRAQQGRVMVLAQARLDIR